jgi:hypothetical protein
MTTLAFSFHPEEKQVSGTIEPITMRDRCPPAMNTLAERPICICQRADEADSQLWPKAIKIQPGRRNHLLLNDLEIQCHRRRAFRFRSKS